MPDVSLWIFFPLAITLHNLEEALWLPKWSKHAKPFHAPIEANEFHFAVIVVTMLAYLSSFLALAFPSVWLWSYFFHGFLGAMIVNTFVPHLVSTIVLRRYSPGLVTGLFLLVPINSLIIYRSISSGSITLHHLIVSVLVVGAMLLSSLPLLFRIGKLAARQVE
jgi:hypothetical protein